MSHDIVEKTVGLASRINNLAIYHTGESSRKLLEQQDRLAKLALVAIVKALNEEHEDYKSAMESLDEAIDFIGNAEGEINEVEKAIRLTAKAVDLVEKALKSAVC